MGSVRTSVDILRLLSAGCAGLLVIACNRAPREPEVTTSPAEQSRSAAPSGASQKKSPPRPTPETSPTKCVHPLSESPPAPVRSVEECPPHPTAAPSMPLGEVRFLDAPGAPQLQVELAQIPAHRAHGLMYRATLPDERGMLFSWAEEAPRSFWMKNTCLALDMLFVDAEGVIVGILQNVPPMNERPRAVPCPAAHVLEVRAGWTEKYGVEPGQTLAVTGDVLTMRNR